MAGPAGLAGSAHELRAQREARGWTQEELAARTNYAPSTIASIETGALKPQAKSAKVFDDVFGLPGTFARIEEMMSGSVYPASFAPFTEYEAEAKTLRTWQHSLVPGLLQTERMPVRSCPLSRTRAGIRSTGW